jgi:hypothetical protein
MHITIILKNNLLKKEKKNTTAQIGTNIRDRGFNAGLLARSQVLRPANSIKVYRDFPPSQSKC